MESEQATTNAEYPSLSLLQGIGSLISPRFLRFVVVGFINTGIDLSVFNLIIFLLALPSFETELIIAKMMGFFLASINSYILNARFTFKKGLHKGDTPALVARRFSIFLIASIIGICINIGVMFVLYRIIIIFMPMHEVLIANVATLGATAVSLVWNFIAYRTFVFK